MKSVSCFLLVSSRKKVNIKETQLVASDFESRSKVERERNSSSRPLGERDLRWSRIAVRGVDLLRKSDFRVVIASLS